MKRGTAYLCGLIVLCFVYSCSSASKGQYQLSEGSMDKIAVGESTQDEVKNMFGEPQKVMGGDKGDIDAYIYGKYLQRLPNNLPDGQYQLWEYVKITAKTNIDVEMISPVPEEDSTKIENCGIVFNSEGVCMNAFCIRRSKSLPKSRVKDLPL
jgi:hypothetical protein